MENMSKTTDGRFIIAKRNHLNESSYNKSKHINEDSPPENSKHTPLYSAPFINNYDIFKKPKKKKPKGPKNKGKKSSKVPKKQKKKSCHSLLIESGSPRVSSQSLSEYIFTNMNLKVINNQIHLYDEITGHFRNIDGIDISTYIYSEIPDEIKKLTTISNINETIKFIRITSEFQVSPEDIPENKCLMNVTNGVMDIKKFELLPHDPKYYFLNCINANFIQGVDIKDSLWGSFLKSVTGNNNHLMKTIQEVTGYTLSNLTTNKGAFLILGKSNSGKSVFLHQLESLIGDTNVCHIPLHKLTDERYSAELYGKLLNVCYELSSIKMNDISNFKSIVSSDDKITAKKLYNSPFSFRNISKLWMASNLFPSIELSNQDDIDAFFNRLLIIPFNISIPEEEQDKHLSEKLYKEKDIFLSWAIQGLYNYIKNGFKFYLSESSTESLDYYKNSFSPYKKFFKDICLYEKGSYTFKSDLQEAFISHCNNEGYLKPSGNDLKLLDDLLNLDNRFQYRKLHRGKENKYGYDGLKLSF